MADGAAAGSAAGPVPGYSERAGGGTVSLATGMAGGRAAAVVPGLFHSADGPLLMGAALAVERRSGSVGRISWTVPQSGVGDDEWAWVAARVSEAVDAGPVRGGATGPDGLVCRCAQEDEASIQHRAGALSSGVTAGSRSLLRRQVL